MSSERFSLDFVRRPEAEAFVAVLSEAFPPWSVILGFLASAWRLVMTAHGRSETGLLVRPSPRRLTHLWRRCIWLKPTRSATSNSGPDLAEALRVHRAEIHVNSPGLHAWAHRAAGRPWPSLVDR